MKFNHDGGYLATGGDEIVVKVWKVTEQSSGAKKSFDSYSNDATEDPRHYFEETPYRIFSGHEKEIVDLDWSGEVSTNDNLKKKNKRKKHNSLIPLPIKRHM